MTPLPAGARRIEVGIGQLWFGRGAVRLTTVLGSCVAICVYHPRQKVGGMCHVVLPGRGAAPARPEPRYADEAVALFESAAAGEGLALAQCQVKLFGGGDMFGGGSNIAVGRNNVAAARRALAQAGVCIQAEHVGGFGHRKLAFDLWSGEVWLTFPNGHGAERTRLGVPH